ncbi:UNVERIFIED_CONTAM: putative protein YtfP [Sesamum angustifolium]|uniref:RsdA/BaiN/AoA(So)-like insert domain-containing protein n=1 Tax=Sesamum angustifolium TaxID=2727405 RepID=A0AAW2ITV8_9LAMI
MHGQLIPWVISDRGVQLKTEVDGRVFPISNSSSTIIDCLMSEAKNRGVNYVDYIEASYVMIASGSSEQGYKLAAQFGHSIVKPVPSLFTFKIDDFQLVELSGVGPMLVTHWGFSGPVILRLSAWGARELSDSDYKGSLVVDFVPDLHIEDVKAFLVQHKNKFAKQRVINSFPSELGLVKRFWRYILEYEDFVDDLLWASISNNLLIAIASRLKNCCFRVKGKGQFKDEFVTAGGVPLSEISLNTMQSRIKSHLFFAGENAWSGGYIAGTSIGNLATATYLKEEAV